MSSHRLFLLCLVHLANFFIYPLNKYLLSDEWQSITVLGSLPFLLQDSTHSPTPKRSIPQIPEPQYLVESSMTPIPMLSHICFHKEPFLSRLGMAVVLSLPLSPVPSTEGVVTLGVMKELLGI